MLAGLAGGQVYSSWLQLKIDPFDHLVRGQQNKNICKILSGKSFVNTRVIFVVNIGM